MFQQFFPHQDALCDNTVALFFASPAADGSEYEKGEVLEELRDFVPEEARLQTINGKGISREERLQTLESFKVLLPSPSSSSYHMIYDLPFFFVRSRLTAACCTGQGGRAARSRA